MGVLSNMAVLPARWLDLTSIQCELHNYGKTHKIVFMLPVAPAPVVEPEVPNAPEVPKPRPPDMSVLVEVELVVDWVTTLPGLITVPETALPELELVVVEPKRPPPTTYDPAVPLEVEVEPEVAVPVPVVIEPAYAREAQRIEAVKTASLVRSMIILLK